MKKKGKQTGRKQRRQLREAALAREVEQKLEGTFVRKEPPVDPFAEFLRVVRQNLS